MKEYFLESCHKFRLSL